MSTRIHLSRGFTLLELMFAVAVGAILMGVAIPSFNNFMRNARITSPSNELLTAFYLARNEAIKRRVTTVFCFSTTPSAALPDCNGTGASGWVVWVDVANPAVPSANDRNGRVDAGEPILLRHVAIAPTVNAKTVPANNGHYVSFAGSGVSRVIAALGTQPVTGVVLCDSRGNIAINGTDSAARGVLITAVGRARVTRLVTDITAAPLGGCP